MENQNTERTAVVLRSRHFGWLFASLMSMALAVMVLFLWREISMVNTKLEFLGQKADAINSAVTTTSTSSPFGWLNRSVGDLSENVNRMVGGMPNNDELTKAVGDLSKKVETGLNKVSRDLQHVQVASKATQQDFKKLAEEYEKMKPQVVNVKVVKERHGTLLVSTDGLK
jgi:uncharacterized protein YoxC